MLETSEEVQERSTEERLDFGGMEEFSRSRKSSITYTRALLLKFNDVEICRKLPTDLDLLVLRSSQFDGESDGLAEHEKISSNSLPCGPCPSPRRNLGVPGERRDNQLSMSGQESYLKGSCRSGCNAEENNVMCQKLPRESECSVLDPKAQSVTFQLRKSENPYRPPHCNKKTSGSLDTYALGDGSSFSDRITEQKDSDDGLIGVDSINSSLLDSERNNERSGVIDVSLEPGITEDTLLFDDFWDEILETLHLQLEPKFMPPVTHDHSTDSEIGNTLLCKDSSTLAEGSTSENFNLTTLIRSEDLVKPEAEVILPDEDSLITIDDLIAPHSLIPKTIKARLQSGKVTSDEEVYLRRNLESPFITKPGDRTAKLGKFHSFLDLSRSVAHRKLHSHLPHSPTTDVFGLEKPSIHIENDQMSPLSEFVSPNFIPYTTTLYFCNKCSKFQDQLCHENFRSSKRSKDSLVQYSLSQQPNISPINQVAPPELKKTMEFSYLTPQKTNAGCIGNKEAYNLRQCIGGHFQESSDKVLELYQVDQQI